MSNVIDIGTWLVNALRDGIKEIKRDHDDERRIKANLPHNKTYSEHSGSSS